ncbi:MAG: DDE-type integrase/transposase/recombinase [Rhodobacteraceae bacterium]|nr:DDE-type integrase/transposase/recombinase [Paracoccaceae bacterium]
MAPRRSGRHHSGEQQYLWRAVDQDGDVLDILVQKRKNKRAAKRFLRKLLKAQGSSPNKIVTDRLTSYGAPIGAERPVSLALSVRQPPGRDGPGARDRLSLHRHAPDQEGRVLA